MNSADRDASIPAETAFIWVWDATLKRYDLVLSRDAIMKFMLDRDPEAAMFEGRVYMNEVVQPLKEQ